MDHICKQPLAITKPIVREFYANANEHNNGSAFIQGKFVPFTTDAINAYFEILEAVVNEYYEYIKREPNFNEVINHFCKRNGEWKMSKGLPSSFKMSQLHGAYKCWLYYLAARLISIKHVNDITKDRALLLYCILIGKAIDVGKLIYITILHSTNTPREGI